MEPIVESFPNRPLTDDEADELEARDDVTSILPVYAGMVSASAFGMDKIPGISVVMDDGAYALAFDPDSGEWNIIKEVELNGDPMKALYEALGYVQEELGAQSGFGA